MRKKLIVANWKSNKNPEEANVWLDELAKTAYDQKLKSDNFEVVICPPYLDLPTLNYKLTITKFPYSVSLGSQDVSPFDPGSYTGAVSASQLKGLVKYTLVGHSERRKYFSETTGLVEQKITLLLKEKIKPIICASSLEDVPSNLKNYSPHDIVIMFEPATAISTGGVYKAEDPTMVQNTIASWKEKLGDFQFLYGGSVNSDNAKQLLSAGAEGFVIGHASLSSDTFYQILENV